MKPRLEVIYGQTPNHSTSFQTSELCRHLTTWFEIEYHQILHSAIVPRQFARLWSNYVRPALQRPRTQFVLYGNDGLARLTHWNATRILYWYDAPEDWSAHSPQSFKDRLRMENVRVADQVFAVAAAQVRLAEALRPSRELSVHYLPVGVDCDFFDPAKADRAGMRQRLGLQEREIVVGYLGYLGKWKGRFAGEALLEAALLLKDLNMRYLVIGTGPALADWRAAVAQMGLQDRFIFTGFIPLPELPSTLAATDICVDTLEPGFHSEARSETKLKQYMAMGRACVATDIGENRVDLDNGEAGLLAPAERHGLAACIRNLASDPASRDHFGALARERAKNGYNWRILARKFAEKALSLNPRDEFAK